MDTAAPAQATHATPEIGHFMLENGMEVVVIPDHRAPVVTHMVWYRNGSADDPVGKSGIAHFLEHLMFKGTKKHPDGAFSRIVAELGGQDNAFTSYDYTAYFQRVAREHLPTVMAIEADRMKNLVLSDDKVTPERGVVLEERKMRTDSDPSAQLSETMAATLFLHHPYGLPIIGWQHEIEGLGREDALAYYDRFYTPENAILVVAGDVTAEAVHKLARDSYGRIAARGAAPVRARPQEPEPRAARRVTLADGKVEQPMVTRNYLVPPHSRGEGAETYALEVLCQIMGGGETGRLYQTLVMQEGSAVHAGAWYMSSARDMSQLAVQAVPAEEVSLDELEAGIDRVIATLSREEVSDVELQRAKTRLVADLIYAQDSQSSMARIYGSELAIGGTVADIREWPDRIEAVSAGEIRQAATKWLQLRRSVTGWLVPEAEVAA